MDEWMNGWMDDPVNVDSLPSGSPSIPHPEPVPATGGAFAQRLFLPSLLRGHSCPMPHSALSLALLTWSLLAHWYPASLLGCPAQVLPNLPTGGQVVGKEGRL